MNPNKYINNVPRKKIGKFYNRSSAFPIYAILQNNYIRNKKKNINMT